MRSIAFIVAVAATPLLLAPAVADGIPGYREEVEGHASDIGARPVEVRNEASPERISAV